MVENALHDFDKTGDAAALRYESRIEKEALKNVLIRLLSNRLNFFFSLSKECLFWRFYTLYDGLKYFVDASALLGWDIHEVLKVKI